MDKVRIEYIDALRGFTMLLVVMGHVEIFGFQLLDTPLLRIISTFHVPLFFFLSGLMAYRASSSWSGRFVRVLSQKIRQLLIPTILFGALFAILHERVSLQTFITHPYKMGYWFTVALFQMFVMLYLINHLCWTINKRQMAVGGLWVTLLICSSVLLYIAKIPAMRIPMIFNIANIGSWHCLFLYFQFFAFGLIFSHYKEKFIRTMNNTYIEAIGIILFLVLVYCRHELISEHETSAVDIWKLLGTFMDTCGGYLGIIIVYHLFHKYQSHFTTASKLGACLQTIGRRTLDVYLLHWFFLSTILWLAQSCSLTKNLITEITACIIIALSIIACCLFISRVLRASDFLAYWLFGAKRSESKQ